MSVLEVEGEVRGQDGLFQQLHEVAVLCGRQVAEDVMTLWRHIPGKRESLNIQHSCTQSAQNKGACMNYLVASMANIYITEGQHYLLLIIADRSRQQGMVEQK